MKLTTEQEAALGIEGPRVAIAAGAGSGKTTLLCEAIWRDLEEGGTRGDEIFVATYNRAAAAHLVDRLQTRFAEGRGAGRPGLDLSAAWVGTFHGLCARIVREHPFTAGIDPEFGELDDAEAGALMDEAFLEALAVTDHPGLRALLETVVSTGRVQDSVISVHARLRAAGMEEPALQIPIAKGPRQVDLAEADRLLRAIGAHPDARERHLADVSLARTMLDTGVPTPQRPTIYGHATNALKELIGPCKDVLERIWRCLVEQDAQPQLEGFAELLSAYSTGYAALKARRGALDYEDLQLAARRVLRGDHPYRFTRVYVDEFQDANAIQNDILDLLGAERTVVVGDGTQAIYRFRHADATHFLGRISDSAGATLEDNHRSHTDVLAALNGLLGRALSSESSFGRLVAHARERPELPPVRTPALEVVTVHDGADGRPSRVQEAEVLCEVIGELADEGYEYRHIAVLFRALTQVSPYREALEAAGIPHQLVMGHGFFSHEQVADVLALLALVENPRDEEALVRALASPYAAASDSELVAIRRVSGRKRPLVDAKDDVRPLGDLLGEVERLRSFRREAGLAGLVEAAIGARGYELAALGLSEGERRYANLRKLVRFAESFEAVRGPDLHGFLRWLELQKELGADPGEATLVDPTRDAVALATIHAAKGQEFPAVILADASHGTPGESGLVLCDREGNSGIAVRRPGAGSSAAVLGLEELRDAEVAEADAEERRLLYVALTRAERHAVVIGRAKSGRGATHHKILTDVLPSQGDGVLKIDGGEVRHRNWVVDPVPEREFLAEPVAPATTEAQLPVVAPPPQADPIRGRRLSFSALSTLEACPRRFHLEYECGLRGREDGVVAERDATSGSRWGGTVLGELVHRFLAEHDWSATLELGWASAAAQAAGLPPSLADAERAEQLVGQLVSGPIGDRVRAARAVWFERAFTFTLDGALLSGAVDLMLEEQDGRVALCDWKTHTLEGRERAALEDEYRLQMSIYGLAALRSGASLVELSWVFLEDQANPLRRVVAPSDLGSLENEVRVPLGALRRPERPAVAREPIPICARCPGLDGGCPVARHGS